VGAAGALRGWPIWIAVLPAALWALVRTFGLEGGRVVPLLAFTPTAASPDHERRSLRTLQTSNTDA